METSTEIDNDANAPSIEHEPSTDTNDVSADAVNGNDSTTEANNDDDGGSGGGDGDGDDDAKNGNTAEASNGDESTSAKDANNSPVMEIKGIVQGEADNNVVQSAGHVNLTRDQSIKV